MAEVDGSLIDISTDINKFKVPDLKRELKLRGLSTSGNKTDLVERLQKSLNNNGSVEHDSVEENEELLEEDILEDDDDEHLDASESLILDNELDESPKGQSLKRKADSDDSETKTTATKKVVLNRNSSIVAEPIKSHTENKPSTEGTQKDESNSEQKKIIRLSQVNAKERLELRAKKFGITALSADAKKAVRAERFGAGTGSTSTNGNSASSITSAKVTTSVEILKKRAERFGCSVSTAVLSLENKEKMEKRKARFGLSTAANGVNEDKAKARLERFKQPVV